MRFSRKHIVIGIFGFVVLAGLGFLLLVLAAGSIWMDTRAGGYVEALEKKIDGDITYQSVDLQLFPRPYLSLRGVNISLPEKAEIQMPGIRLYPKITALLRGKFIAGVIKLEGFRSTVAADWLADKNPDDRSVKAVISRIQGLRESALSKLPDMRITFSRGEIEITDGNRPIYRVSPIDADIKISDRYLKIAVNCRSGFWQTARFYITMNSRAGIDQALIDIEGFRLDHAPHQVIPLSDARVSRLRSDFQLLIKQRKGRDVWGKIKGTIPELTLATDGGKRISLSCSRFHGDFQQTADRVRITVDRLALKQPNALLSGRFNWDRKTSMALLQIDGSISDVSGMREAALLLAGRYRTTQRLFTIIRDGAIPTIAFRASADCPENFKKVENISLKGNMISGTIVPPGLNRNLENVSGDVELKNGILHGKNIQCSLKSATGWEGRFSIGMAGYDPEVYVETRLATDASQIPPILTDLIKNAAFRREMNRITSTSGKASGTLVLEGRRHSVKPRVMVDDFAVNVDYGRAPLPLMVKGGKLWYENRRLRLTGISGKMGANTISNLDVAFAWKDLPSFSGSADELSVSAREIWNWIKTFSTVPHAFSTINDAEGSLFLSRTEFGGPLFHPHQWHFTTSGSTNDLEIGWNHSRSQLRVRGRIEAAHDRMSFSSLTYSSSGTALTGSCEAIGRLGHFEKVNAELAGEIRPETLMPNASDGFGPINIPPGKWRLHQSSIVWNPGEMLHVKASASAPHGPELSIDLLHTNEALSIKNLVIKAGDSDAAITFHRKNSLHEMQFNGRLTPGCLEGFLDRPFLVDGDFQVNFTSDFSKKPVFIGRAEFADFDATDRLHFPAVVKKALITGQNGDPVIRAQCTLNSGETFLLDGTILPHGSGMLGRFDISFDDLLDVNRLIDHIRRLPPEKGPDGRERFYDAEVAWNLTVTAPRMDFGAYSWMPVHANVAVLPEHIDVEINHSDLCGITTSGEIHLTPKSIHMSLLPIAEKQPLADMIPCLGGKDGLIRGNVDISGTVTAQGPYDALWPAMAGDFELTAGKGRIYRFGLLAKLFSILNITEIFRGTLPDLTREGFQYQSIDISGTIAGETLTISKALIDADAMNMLFRGNLNIRSGILDITLLVAPLKTVDFIVQKTPIVNEILEGNLVTIAIDIKGDIADPEIIPLPPSAIGGGFLKILENTLKLPVKVIQPIIDKTKEENHGDQDRQN
ncbi:MAG: AsmA-like C-terminal domain-containing protein [Desulfobacterales bacterium]